MKKIYSKPETLVTAISCCTLICESLGFAGDASANSITSADSRRSTVWDDDEE